MTLLGIPLEVVVFAVMIAGLLVGGYLLLRVAAGEGDFRSFRATDRPDVPSMTAIAVVAVVGLALAALLAIANPD